MLSAVEKQQKRRRESKNGHDISDTTTTEDMSGELQTIPARHGVATFVPRGRTIKIINTYGKQVVSMWAFTLGAPPEEGEGEELNEEEVKREAEGMKKAVEEGKQDVEKVEESKEEGKKEGGDEEKNDGEDGEKKDGEDEIKNDGTEEAKKDGDEAKETQQSEDSANKTSQETEDPPEQAPDAPDTPENEKKTETTDSSSKQPAKRTWASYLPSIPYRNKGAANKQEAEQKPTAEQEKKQNEENTKKWSSYLPTGKSFTSYVPSESIVSAFKASHQRDPNKSYAEQLYDFSKTPVGAGTIAGTFLELIATHRQSKLTVL